MIEVAKSNMANPENQTHGQKENLDLDKVYKLIQKGSEAIRPEIQKSTIIIGQTGVGKSTIINGLIGKRLISKKKGIQYIVQLSPESEDKGAKIGSTIVSETSIPIHYRDQKGNIFWDCPGFEDSKGPEQDIVNGFLINKLFENSQKIKIILVLTHQAFQSDRYKQLREIVKKISELFIDLQECLRNLIIVINKASKELEHHNYREIFGEIIQEQKQYCEKENLDLFSINEKITYENFLKNTKIILIYKPHKEGSFTIDQLQQIKEGIYMDNQKINIPISPASQIHLSTLCEDILVKVQQKNQSLIKNVQITLRKNSQLYQNQFLIKSSNQINSQIADKLFDKIAQILDLNGLTKNLIQTTKKNNQESLKSYNLLSIKFLQYFNTIKYSLKRQLEIIFFCKKILQNVFNFDRIVGNLWVQMLKLLKKTFSQIYSLIQKIYQKYVFLFVQNLKKKISEATEKKRVIILIKELQVFSSASKIQVIEDLKLLKQISIQKKCIINLIQIHTKIKKTNPRIKKDMQIQIKDLSQTVKNYLNQHLNILRNKFLQIEHSENCVRTLYGQETQLICSKDITYYLINPDTDYCLSFSGGLRMSYPTFRGGSGTNFHFEIFSKNMYRIYQIGNNNIFYLSAEEVQYETTTQNPINPLIYKLDFKYEQIIQLNKVSTIKNKNKQWKVKITDYANENSLWGIKVLKNGMINIVHMKTKFLLAGGSNTYVGSSVFFSKDDKGYEDWSIEGPSR